MWKPFKFKWEHIVTFAGVLIAGFSLFRTCQQDKKIEYVTFQNQGIQNRPLLKIIGKPEIIYHEMKSKDPFPDSFFSKKTVIPPLKFVLTLSIRITVVNESESNARLIGFVFTDIPAGTPDIREALLDPEKRKKIQFERSADFYKTVEIQPGEKRIFEISKTIEAIKDNIFVMHVIFLYTNELDNLYDSYYWVRYKVNEFIIEKQGDNYIIKKDELSKFTELVDDNFSTKMYSKEESKTIREYFRSILESNK